MRLSMCARLPRLVSAALLAAALAACENRTLAVRTPDIAQPSVFDNPAALPQLSAAVIADFSQSYSGQGGGYEGIIMDGGLLGDEWISSDTYPTRIQIDQRTTVPTNAQNNQTFLNIQIGRTAAEQAITAYEKFQPGVALEAEAFSFAGMAYVLIAENFCTGIPFSSVNLTTGKTTFGPLESTNQMLGDAHARFDSALAILAADTASADQANIPNEQYLAEIEAARALLDSGDYTDAAALVVNVPDLYLYSVGYSFNSTNQYNGVYEFSDNEKRYSVPSSEGTNGLPYRADSDARVVWFDAGTGFNSQTENFSELKYPGENFPIPVATGIEALLIRAEAAFNTSGPAAALPFINRARTAWNSVNRTLNSTAAVGDTIGQASSIPSGQPGLLFIFKERAYDLWLTAHRLGDMRRLIRQYGFTADQVFPVGPYPLGGNYGDEVALLLPATEASNPNYAVCDGTVP
jgi:starch-binding outer membrane protein, SusD/RagB family